MFKRVNGIRIWPPRRDECSGVQVGAGGTCRSDWPERAREKKSIARVQGAIDSRRVGTRGRYH